MLNVVDVTLAALKFDATEVFPDEIVFTLIVLILVKLATEQSIILVFSFALDNDKRLTLYKLLNVDEAQSIGNAVPAPFLSMDVSIA